MHYGHVLLRVEYHHPFWVMDPHLNMPCHGVHDAVVNHGSDSTTASTTWMSSWRVPRVMLWVTPCYVVLSIA